MGRRIDLLTCILAGMSFVQVRRLHYQSAQAAGSQL